MQSPATEGLQPVFGARGFHVERLQCPEHFQERIRQVAGVNRYGADNYKLAWAQTETTVQGGEWEAAGEAFTGYQRVYLSDGLPHWILLKWVDAGKSLDMPFLRAQGPTAFYDENKCPKTGLQLLGEYPYHGSYKVALPLVAKWFERGQLRIHAYPLDVEIVEMMIPVIQASMALSIEAKMRFLQEEKEAKEVESDKLFGDVYQDIKLSNAARASEWIRDKERQIERAFNAHAMARLASNRRFQTTKRL